MELHDLFNLLERLSIDASKACDNPIILEPAGGSDSNKETFRRLHHYTVSNGHPHVIAWGIVMPHGPRDLCPRIPCARVSILGRLLDKNDDKIRRLHQDTDGDWGRDKGEVYGCISQIDDGRYADVLYALTMACKASLT
jgi:hypothetical protein